MHVVGGTYLELCREPRWEQLFGSGLRAAAAVSRCASNVTLVTYVSSAQRPTLEGYTATFSIDLRSETIPETLCFRYAHSLARPEIEPPLHLVVRQPPVSVEADVVLRFGMLEGDAVVRGRRVVYDPQSAHEPRAFAANGSSAEHLAVVANLREARRLTGREDLEAAAQSLRDGGAEVVVLKLAARGVVVATAHGLTAVPAYRTDRVFKIGSGDFFAAVFAHEWGEKQFEAVTAAERASRATAWYCDTRQADLAPDFPAGVTNMLPVTPTSGGRQPRRVYLAGPFFTIAERWLIHEARAALLAHEVAVFSPFHDVGLGEAQDVAGADLEALGDCDAVLALADGGDPGTLFEIGYARALGLPVVVLAQREPTESLKMLAGSACEIVSDLGSAVYRAVWAAIER